MSRPLAGLSDSFYVAITGHRCLLRRVNNPRTRTTSRERRAPRDSLYRTSIGADDLTRKGPLCFCHGYRRYREFTRPLLVSGRLDPVIRTDAQGSCGNPKEVLV